MLFKLHMKSNEDVNSQVNVKDQEELYKAAEALLKTAGKLRYLESSTAKKSLSDKLAALIRNGGGLESTGIIFEQIEDEGGRVVEVKASSLSGLQGQNESDRLLQNLVGLSGRGRGTTVLGVRKAFDCWKKWHYKGDKNTFEALATAYLMTGLVCIGTIKSEANKALAINLRVICPVEKIMASNWINFRAWHVLGYDILRRMNHLGDKVKNGVLIQGKSDLTKLDLEKLDIKNARAPTAEEGDESAVSIRYKISKLFEKVDDTYNGYDDILAAPLANVHADEENKVNSFTDYDKNADQKRKKNNKK